MAKNNPINILIVDDERNVAFLLAQSLRRIAPGAYDVHISYTAEEAIALLPGYNFELVISDLRLPGMSGMELLGQIRAGFKNTRTILMTGYGTEQTQADAKLVANAYITKPFQISEVVKLVEDVLSRPAAIIPPIPPSPPVVVTPVQVRVAQDPHTQAHLEELYNQVGARSVLMMNLNGQMLGNIGRLDDIDLSDLNRLFLASASTAGDLAKIFKTRRPFDLNYYDGDRYELYIRQVDETRFVAVLLDVQATTTRTGAMRFYLKRAVDAIREQKTTSASKPETADKPSAQLKQITGETASVPEEEAKPSRTHIEPREIDDQTVLSFEEALKFGLLNNLMFEELPLGE